jgi:hypothetical protein
MENLLPQKASRARVCELALASKVQIKSKKVQFNRMSVSHLQKTSVGELMSLASQATQQKFPFKYDQVLDALVRVIPDIGFTLKSEDKVIGRVTASAGMSLFSWGENITMIVEKIDDNSTLVGIESSLKLGANIAGAHRHQKNFDKIIQALSSHLQSK